LLGSGLEGFAGVRPWALRLCRGQALCSVFRLSDASCVRLNDALRQEVRKYFASDWKSDGDKQYAFSVFAFDPKQIAEKRTFNQIESAGAVSLRRAAETAQKTHLNGCGICWKASDPFWRERVWGEGRNAVNDD
jgi:hypothetical protein